VPHRGHEYIQRKALEETQADGIFLSPVTGIKKKGDFTAVAIIHCFEKLIMEGFYDPFGALIGSFNTYSRYSGPKEAVFTAICRKNYGCNYFIVGRDHTGVGNYYASDASQTIFDELDVGMKILKFDKVSYCPERKKITENNFNKNIYEISGTKVRDMIINEIEIPDYLLDPIIAKTINKLYLKDKTAVFEK
jgi:ATP sulfurylase